MGARLALALELFDIEPKAHEHECDRDEADAEAYTALVALDHRVVARFLIGSGDLLAGLNILIDESGLEAVNGDARLGKSVAGLILVEPGFTDFHAGGFGKTQGLVGVVD